MADFRDHVLRAIEAVGGSQVVLAQKMGVSQQGISFLLTRAKGCSAEVAVKIDAATNGVVSKADLRPDLFGDNAA